jgi:CBS domain-containing protein
MTGCSRSVIGFDRFGFLGLFVESDLKQERGIRVETGGPVHLNATLVEFDPEARRAYRHRAGAQGVASGGAEGRLEWWPIGNAKRGVGVEQQDIRELKVSDIAHEEWPTLGPQETVEGAIKVFAESGISGVPVVEGERLVGIVTEGDLIFRDADIKSPGFLDILGGMIPLGDWNEYRREALKSAAVTVDQVMTREVRTIRPDATLAEAATVMAENRVKILPVTERRRPPRRRYPHGHPHPPRP